jgi:serine/threonine-protein kinase
MDAIPKTIGRYEVKKLLGEGGLGRVYLAVDTMLARDVAVKVVRPDLAMAEDAKHALSERLKHQARAAAAMAHPNVAALHDMGEDPAVGLYLVFEYVRGPSLRQRIEHEPLPLDEVARLALELGSALAFAHESGILHRDIKPENILLGRFGTKITDFGIARVPDSTVIQAHIDMGPPAYTSPEALSRGVYTARNDQYSMATTLVEALTGERPASTEDGELGPLTIPDCDPALAERLTLILRRGRSPRAEERFPTCRDLGEAVDAVIETLGGVSSQRFSLSGSPRISSTPGQARLSTPPPPHVSEEPDPAQEAAGRQSMRKTQNIIVGLALVVLAALFLLRREQQKKGGADAGTDAAAETSAPKRIEGPKPAPTATPTSAASAATMGRPDAGTDGPAAATGSAAPPPAPLLDVPLQ